MEIKGRFDHFNFNVLDLEKSIRFYEKALGLKEVRRKTASDGSFILVYMGDGEMVDASSAADKVVQRRMRTDYWERYFSHALRFE